MKTYENSGDWSMSLLWGVFSPPLNEAMRWWCHGVFLWSFDKPIFSMPSWKEVDALWWIRCRLTMIRPNCELDNQMTQRLTLGKVFVRQFFWVRFMTQALSHQNITWSITIFTNHSSRYHQQTFSCDPGRFMSAILDWDVSMGIPVEWWFDSPKQKWGSPQNTDDFLWWLRYVKLFSNRFLNQKLHSPTFFFCISSFDSGHLKVFQLGFFSPLTIMNTQYINRYTYIIIIPYLWDSNGVYVGIETLTSRCSRENFPPVHRSQRQLAQALLYAADDPRSATASAAEAWRRRALEVLRRGKIHWGVGNLWYKLWNIYGIAMVYGYLWYKLWYT